MSEQQREQRPNSGIAFKNEDRESNSHPHYKGWGDVGGKAVWIAVWIKEGKNGKFLSLSIKHKDDMDDQPRRETQQQAAPTLSDRSPGRPDRFEDMKGDIPF